MSITKVQPSLFSPIHQLLYAAEMAQAHNWPDATTKCFWSTTERTARREPISCRAARQSSGRAFSPRPTTRRWLRPIRPTGTIFSGSTWPNIRRLTGRSCRKAKAIRPFSPGKREPTSTARLFRVIRRPPQLPPMGCRSRG